MAVEYLYEWRNEYACKLTGKREEHKNFSDLLLQKKEEMKNLEQKINCDESVFNPNDMYIKERVQSDQLLDEIKKLTEVIEKDEQNIMYLEERIRNLDKVLDEIKLLKNDDMTDKIQFIADIVESDPRRAKIELTCLMECLKDVSRETLYSCR